MDIRKFRSKEIIKKQNSLKSRLWWEENSTIYGNKQIHTTEQKIINEKGKKKSREIKIVALLLKTLKISNNVLNCTFNQNFSREINIVALLLKTLKYQTMFELYF